MGLFLARKRILIADCCGQAAFDYVLVLAVLALALTGMSLVWKGPLAHYLQQLAQSIAKIR